MRWLKVSPMALPASLWPGWIDCSAPRVTSSTWAVSNAASAATAAQKLLTFQPLSVIDEEDEDEERDATQAVAIETDRPIDKAGAVGEPDAEDDAEDERDDHHQRRDVEGDEKPVPQEGQALDRDLHHARLIA